MIMIWPKDTHDQKELFEFFGEPGENQKRLVLPYEMKCHWNLEAIIKSFPCHEKVHDSLGRIFQRIYEEYGLEEIKRLRLDIWSGCLNVRPKRGGNTYSLHAWGAAIDFDKPNNELRWGSNRAMLARPEYDQFWKAFEDEEWLSLGRLKNYDWMHVQAARSHV